MAIFPYPDNNITGLVSLIDYTNQLTVGDGQTGILGVAILIIVAFVSFLATKGFSADRSFGFTAFLSLIVAILLRFLNLINDAILIIVLVLFTIAMIWLMVSRNREVGAV